MRSHAHSILDTIIGSGLFLLGAFWLHWRAKTESIGLHDAVIFALCVIAGLAVGYRDRVPLLTASVSKVVKARFSGSHQPPDA